MPIQTSLSSIDRIRVLMNSGPGSGTQSASISLMKYLVRRGFNGVFEVVYTAPIKPIIANLLNVEEAALDAGYNQNHLRIELVELKEFVMKRHTDDLPELPLGVTGDLEWSIYGFRPPIDDDYVPFNDSALEAGAKINLATFLNVTSFVYFNSYTGEYSDTYIHHKNQDNSERQVNSGKRLTFYPVYQLTDAIHYLLHHTKGQQLADKLPALLPFMELIAGNHINYIPVYGRGIEEEDVRFISHAAQYAQQSGGFAFQKPMIVAVFDQSLVNVSNRISLTDPSIISRLKREKDTTFTLVSDRLPNIVYDAIACHPQALSPIFEGTGSFNSLLLSGKAHLHWKLLASWPLVDRNMSQALNEKFNKLDNMPLTLIDGWNWVKKERYSQEDVETVADYFIDAKRESDVSDFFADLPRQALQEDRFAYGLEPLVQLDPYHESQEMLSVQGENALQSSSANLFAVGSMAFAGALLYGLFGRCLRKRTHKHEDGLAEMSDISRLKIALVG